jgi:hypothetical protein
MVGIAQTLLMPLKFYTQLAAFLSKSTVCVYGNVDYWKREQNLYEIDVPGISNFQNEDENRNNLLSLLGTPKARNSLKFEYDRKKIMLDLYQNKKEEAARLIIEIDKELEK